VYADPCLVTAPNTTPIIGSCRWIQYTVRDSSSIPARTYTTTTLTLRRRSGLRASFRLKEMERYLALYSLLIPPNFLAIAASIAIPTCTTLHRRTQHRLCVSVSAPPQSNLGLFSAMTMYHGATPPFHQPPGGSLLLGPTACPSSQSIAPPSRPHSNTTTPTHILSHSTSRPDSAPLRRPPTPAQAKKQTTGHHTGAHHSSASVDIAAHQ
jgi:hypothetical protein